LNWRDRSPASTMPLPAARLLERLASSALSETAFAIVVDTGLQAWTTGWLRVSGERGLLYTSAGAG
jgi:hypothetical protein